MSIERATPDGGDFIVVDMPVRLSAEDVLRLNAIASTNLIARSSAGEDANPHERMLTAGRQASRQLDLIQRCRASSFGSLTGDPAWAILLEIFVAHTRGEMATMTSACARSGAPTTTALRYLNALVDQGCVTKTQSHTDSRVYFVELSDKTQDEVVQLLAAYE